MGIRKKSSVSFDTSRIRSPFCYSAFSYLAALTFSSQNWITFWQDVCRGNELYKAVLGTLFLFAPISISDGAKKTITRGLFLFLPLPSLVLTKLGNLKSWETMAWESPTVGPWAGGGGASVHMGCWPHLIRYGVNARLLMSCAGISLLLAVIWIQSTQTERW